MERKKIPPLTANDVEVKIKQCSEKGAVALLYKTARIDMAVLDDIFGAENWECDYKEIKDNLYCGIGVRSGEDKPFVWKWDCGIESREDDEGNQKKGEASDAFKRAAFKWGIGRELYTAPFIYLNVPTKEKMVGQKKTYELEDKFARFECKEIQHDESGKITKVVIVDSKGNVVFPKNFVPKEPKTVKEQEPQTAAVTDKQLAYANNIIITKGSLKDKKLGDLSDETLLKVINESGNDFLIKFATMILEDREEHFEETEQPDAGQLPWDN